MTDELCSELSSSMRVCWHENINYCARYCTDDHVRTYYTNTLHRPKPLLILLSLSFSLPAVDPHSQPATQILASFGTIIRSSDDAEGGLKVVPINNSLPLVFTYARSLPRRTNSQSR